MKKLTQYRSIQIRKWIKPLPKYWSSVVIGWPSFRRFNYHFQWSNSWRFGSISRLLTKQIYTVWVNIKITEYWDWTIKYIYCKNPFFKLSFANKVNVNLNTGFLNRNFNLHTFFILWLGFGRQEPERMHVNDKNGFLNNSKLCSVDWNISSYLLYIKYIDHLLTCY